VNQERFRITRCDQRGRPRWGRQGDKRYRAVFAADGRTFDHWELADQGKMRKMESGNDWLAGIELSQTTHDKND